VWPAGAGDGLCTVLGKSAVGDRRPLEANVILIRQAPRLGTSGCLNLPAINVTVRFDQAPRLGTNECLDLTNSDVPGILGSGDSGNGVWPSLALVVSCANAFGC